MIKFIQKKLFKWSLLRRLEREAWQIEINAVYDLGFVSEIEKIEKAKLKEIEEIGDAHERVKRDRKKQLENELEKLRQTKMQIIQAAESVKQRAAEIRNRMEFIKKNF